MTSAKHTQIVLSELFRAGKPAHALYHKVVGASFCTLSQAWARKKSSGAWVETGAVALGNLYHELTGKRPWNAHHALDDTIMLVYVYFGLNKAPHPRIKLPPQPAWFHIVVQGLHAPTCDRRVRQRLE